MVESSGENIREEKNSSEDNTNIENRGEYSEWVCNRCKWGARGYVESLPLK